MILRSLMKWAPVVCISLLAGCGDRDGSIDAALALAEAVYPGQLEFNAAHLQKDNYDITLAIKGDPVTRIRFGVDRDPARCRVGTPCEERLRKAYAIGLAAGTKLKALGQALHECDVRAIGVHDTHITPDFTTIIELDLGSTDQQPALDQLTSCIASFRQALPLDTSPALRSVAFRILLPADRDVSQQADERLTFEARLPSSRQDEVNYLISIPSAGDHAPASRLRLNPNFLSRQALRETLANAARAALNDNPHGGHVPQMSFLWDTRLDPARIDVFRTYVLACSEHTPGTGPCRFDIAVSMRYDLGTGAVSELSILREVRDAKGELALPVLPGR